MVPWPSQIVVLLGKTFYYHDTSLHQGYKCINGYRNRDEMVGSYFVSMLQGWGKGVGILPVTSCFRNWVILRLDVSLGPSTDWLRLVDLFTTRELCGVFVVVFRPVPDEDEQNKNNPEPLLTLNRMILFITYSPLFVSTGSSVLKKDT